MIHSTIYVSSYYHACVLILLCMCPHTTMCVLILLYVSSYYYICVLYILIPLVQLYADVSPYVYICVLILLYACVRPHNTIYVSSYYCIYRERCIDWHVAWVFVLILLYMCLHTTLYVSSYFDISYMPTYIYTIIKNKTLVNKVWWVISQHLRIARVRIIYIHSQL